MPVSQTASAAAFETVLDDSAITLDLLCRAEGRKLRPQIAESARRRIADCCAAVNRLAAGDAPVYGVNTGFGSLCRQRISPADLAQLQENLVVSHAVGVGPPAPDAVVRWMLWFKLHALCRGYSGIRPETADALCGLLRNDLLPVVPTRGSLGASGDLAPLAHLCLPLIGRGQVRRNGRTIPAAEALSAAGLSPITLGPKEGLALLNGTQYISAAAAHLIVRAWRLARQADIIATMSLDGLRGSVRPFDARLHDLRPHPGAQAVAANVRALMADSEILELHRNCDKVQDPYSLRCVPAVHGACRDALQHATDVTLREINSVTDNPIVFEDECISGGNFHAESMALALDYLALALTEWASISERRAYLLLGGQDGLPPMLAPHSGLNSGLMIVQYTAAALVNECKTLAHPSSIDTIPTSMGQEDHVSMGATSANRCMQIIDHVETVLAIELLCAAQALDFRAPLRAGIGPRTAHRVVREQIPHADVDREFGRDLETARAMFVSGCVLDAVQSEARLL